MQEIKEYKDVIRFCKAMASPIRSEIVQLLLQHGQMNIQDLAMALGVTNGALTSHIRQLSEAGIIHIKNANGTKGIQKLCSLNDLSYLLHLSSQPVARNSIVLDIPVGNYTSHEVHPTCGISTFERLIGYYDNPVFFDDPKRIYAGILWFFRGYVEYTIPNYLETNQKLTELRISQEISSEAPGICENWPSDISFSINGITVGTWTSPGDFGEYQGIYTPSWWPDKINSYGLLKTLSITSDGCYMDNTKLSDYTLHDLNIVNGRSFKYRLSVPDSAQNVGGLTVFGRNFGNYNQDIQVSYIYEDLIREI